MSRFDTTTLKSAENTRNDGRWWTETEGWVSMVVTELTEATTDKMTLTEATAKEEVSEKKYTDTFLMS